MIIYLDKKSLYFDFERILLGKNTENIKFQIAYFLFFYKQFLSSIMLFIKFLSFVTTKF